MLQVPSWRPCIALQDIEADLSSIDIDIRVIDCRYKGDFWWFYGVVMPDVDGELPLPIIIIG